MKHKEVPDEWVTTACEAAYGTPPDPGDDRRQIARAIAAIHDEIRAQFARELVQEFADTMERFSGAEPEGPNPCCMADEHNCHRVAGELTFAEVASIVKWLGGITS